MVTNGGLSVDQMEKLCQGAVSKLVPSVTMEIGRGVSLLCHGDRYRQRRNGSGDVCYPKPPWSSSFPKDQFDVATDLTSCGPALLAEMMPPIWRRGRAPWAI